MCTLIFQDWIDGHDYTQPEEKTMGNIEQTTVAEHGQHPHILRVKDPDGADAFRIVVKGVEHPAFFYNWHFANSQLGLLSQRGYIA